MKSYYDILDVSATSTREQIVAAYRLRSKIFHPDRLDPVKQRAEWELANEMLKELNQAYATLRDPATRAAYDRSFSGSTAAARPAPPRTGAAPRPPPPSPPRVSILPDLAAGHAMFRNLSAKLQQRLIDRRRGKVREQFRARVGRVGVATYLVTVVCCLFLGSLLSSAATQRWAADSRQTNMMFAAVTALVLPLAVFRGIRFYRSPLKRMIFVTPLYFVETRHDEVWYWPLWHVRRIKATHRYYNSIYYGTDVVVTFPTEERRYRIRPQAAYKNLVDAFHVFSEKVLRADAQLDRQYFRDEDDFRDVALRKGAAARKSVFLPSIGAALVFLLAIAATLLAFIVNEDAPKPPPVRLGTSNGSGTNNVSSLGQPSSGLNFNPSRTVPADRIEAAAALAHALLPDTQSPQQGVVAEPYDRSKDPPNGFVYKNSLRNGHGTLKIENGTSYHAVAKLVDMALQRSVFTVFVGAGEEFTIRNIPNGRYRLAFASGRRWNWSNDGFDEPKGSSIFQDEMLFDTRYQRDQDGTTTYYHQFEVTLQPVINGNAQTDVVAPEAFERY